MTILYLNILPMMSQSVADDVPNALGDTTIAPQAREKHPLNSYWNRCVKHIHAIWCIIQ